MLAPHPPPSTRMTASSSQRRHGATARVRLAQGTQNRPFRDREPAPPCPGIRSQKETEIDDPTFMLQPVAIVTAHTADDASPQADQEDLTAPTGYNLLPCDWSCVGRAGTVKPANRGAREVPEHNVTTMTKAKDTAPAPGRRATENLNMEYPKRQGEAKART